VQREVVESLSSLSSLFQNRLKGDTEDDEKVLLCFLYTQFWSGQEFCGTVTALVVARCEIDGVVDDLIAIPFASLENDRHPKTSFNAPPLGRSPMRSCGSRIVILSIFLHDERKIVEKPMLDIILMALACSSRLCTLLSQESLLFGSIAAFSGLGL
jgi:hypothetical protein